MLDKYDLTVVSLRRLASARKIPGRSKMNKAQLMDALAQFAERTGSQSECGKGKLSVTRKAYTRKDGTKVKASKKYCIMDVGKPGRGKKLIPTSSKHLLGAAGYDLSKSFAERKKAMDKVARKEGTLKVLRHLNAIRNKTIVPANKTKLSRDVKYLSEKYSHE